ncbi:TPR repeat [Synechococcus sp. CC9902]|uniref:tetratricopeptide repeat protein n=1 Tax=Synechococcus sp. (strain CC9902) TaxID=316279 RepID=UPI00005D3D0C|nr:tetratricopeptide repeat protein [Synechococcus sp. CC9902]ABB25090.1 TPR repeat [Synechococcus sp. CC9902]
MTFSNFQNSKTNVRPLIFEAEKTTDPERLVSLLSQVSLKSEPVYRFVEALLLWKLNYLDELCNLLSTLPTSFHSDPQYWIFLGMYENAQSKGSSRSLFAYQKALLLSPGRADIHFNLANSYSSFESSKALHHYLVSLSIDSLQSNVWHNLGNLLRDAKFFSCSLTAFKNAHFLSPYDVDILCNFALSLILNGSYKSAELTLVHCLTLNPNHFQSHLNLGFLFIKLRRINEAIINLQEALRLEGCSLCADLKFNLSLCHLLLCNYVIGWDLYENRLYTSMVPLSLHPSHGPLIESLDQLSTNSSPPLLIWSEQGLGDCIQFCRYLLLLDALFIDYDFLCPLPLIALIKNWLNPKGNVLELETFMFSSDRLHCPLLSLPSLFSTTLDSIPSTLPYFSTPKNIPGHLIAGDSLGGLSVGIVWSTSPSNPIMYKNKSIPLKLLMPHLVKLMDLDLVNLHTLQVGPDASQVNPWLHHPRLIDWSSKLSNFSDTAFVISQFDLVISVDTAVAHLSAALNIPTWCLLSHDADFRWLIDRSDSPWYPGVMRLFRQDTLDDWSSVVKSVNTVFDDLFLLDISSVSSSI